MNDLRAFFKRHVVNTKCTAMEILKRALDIPVGTSPFRRVLRTKKKSYSVGTQRNGEAEQWSLRQWVRLRSEKTDTGEFKTL